MKYYVQEIFEKSGFVLKIRITRHRIIIVLWWCWIKKGSIYPEYQYIHFKFCLFGYLSTDIELWNAVYQYIDAHVNK